MGPYVAANAGEDGEASAADQVEGGDTAAAGPVEPCVWQDSYRWSISTP